MVKDMKPNTDLEAARPSTATVTSTDGPGSDVDGAGVGAALLPTIPLTFPPPSGATPREFVIFYTKLCDLVCRAQSNDIEFIRNPSGVRDKVIPKESY